MEDALDDSWPYANGVVVVVDGASEEGRVLEVVEADGSDDHHDHAHDLLVEVLLAVLAALLQVVKGLEAQAGQHRQEPHARQQVLLLSVDLRQHLLPHLEEVFLGCLVAEGEVQDLLQCLFCVVLVLYHLPALHQLLQGKEDLVDQLSHPHLR